MNQKSIRALQERLTIPPLNQSVHSVFLACERIKAMTGNEELAGHESVAGHHSITLPADEAANAAIIDSLSDKFPELRFISEEHDDDPARNAKLVTLLTLYTRIQELQTVAIIDPVCGTSGLRTGHYEWSTSIGFARPSKNALEFFGGVALAPAVHGGMIVMCETGTDVFIGKNVCAETPTIEIAKPAKNPQPKNWYVEIGPDIFTLPQYSRFLLETSRQVRTTNASGSCPLGIMKVVAGMTDAFVQPHQKAVDWAGTYPAVIQAGGAWIFYHFRGGYPVRMTEPDILSFAPGDARYTAFIAAGTTQCAEWLWRILSENWGKPVLP